MQVNSNYRQNIISYENKQKSNGTPTFAQYVTEKNEERLRDEAATDFEERVHFVVRKLLREYAPCED